MSGASADGTTADYSKGPSTRRAGFVNVRGIAAAFVVASVALLVVAELSVVVRVVVGSLETEQRTVTGHANHDWALLLVAIAAVPLAIGALRGARPAAIALIALGAVALVVALAIDLPKTRESGALPESTSFEDAHAKAGPGLAYEIAGGVGLIIAGGLLAAATPSSRRDASAAPAAPARSRRR
jgi:hypothetical protein